MSRLGIDIGRVIIGPVVDGQQDTSFLGTRFEEAMLTPPADGAFDTIARLADDFEQIHLISKCGESVQRKSLGWLDHHDFYGVTGIPRDRVHFCRKRPDKAPIARRLRLTHFIDDRLDVLRPMRGIVQHLLLFGEQEASVHPPWVRHVPDWDAVGTVLGGWLSEATGRASSAAASSPRRLAARE